MIYDKQGSQLFKYLYIHILIEHIVISQYVLSVIYRQQLIESYQIKIFLYNEFYNNKKNSYWGWKRKYGTVRTIIIIKMT